MGRRMTEPVLLIGDLGGTNARFALADAGKPGFHKPMELRCADFATADAAIEHYLEPQTIAAPDLVCLAAAGPVLNGSVCLSNNHWRLDRRALAEQFAVEQVIVLNDFEAVAYALPMLGSSDIQIIGRGDAPSLAGEGFTVGVLGPGTGLGVAGLLGRSGTTCPVVGEGGHIGFAPQTAQQVEVLRILTKRFKWVSNERLVSGPGIENIYAALCTLNGEPDSPRTAAEIFALARAGQEPVAGEAVTLFFEVLGQVAGDLALLLGATDGIFLAGGIVPRYPDLLHQSGFRLAFENKGRHRALLQQIPTVLVTRPDPGLLGAAFRARQAWLALSGKSC